MKEDRIKELIQWARERSKNCPKLKDEINDLVQLAIDEIEEGASISNEINLCMSNINELLNENCN
jgi:hypothetical protein